MKGLHILQFAVEEFHTLIQGSGDHGQILIGGPGLKQGLLFEEGVFAEGQRFLVKGVRQLF